MLVTKDVRSERRRYSKEMKQWKPDISRVTAVCTRMGLRQVHDASFHAGSRVTTADDDTWDPCREHCATVYSVPARMVSDGPPVGISGLLQAAHGGSALSLYSEPH